MKTLFTFCTLAILLVFTTACDKEPTADCGSVEIVNMALSDAVEAATDAALVYIGDPTEANCEKIRAAWLDYIDVAESYLDCDFVNRQDLQDSIDEARIDAETADCSE